MPLTPLTSRQHAERLADFNTLRECLRELVETIPYHFKDEHGADRETTSTQVTAIPYLDRTPASGMPEEISFLYCGFEVTLHSDGTWGWGDTTGG